MNGTNFSFVHKIIVSFAVMLVGLLGSLTILHGSIVAAFTGTPDNNLLAFLKLSGLLPLLIFFAIIFVVGFVLLLFYSHRK